MTSDSPPTLPGPSIAEHATLSAPEPAMSIGDNNISGAPRENSETYTIKNSDTGKHPLRVSLSKRPVQYGLGRGKAGLVRKRECSYTEMTRRGPRLEEICAEVKALQASIAVMNERVNGKIALLAEIIAADTNGSFL